MRKVSTHLQQLFIHANSILQARPELEEAERMLEGTALLEAMKKIGTKYNIAGAG